MRQFIATLARVETGHAEAIIIEAESGLGSSRLVAEMAATAAATGWNVVGPGVHRLVALLPDLLQPQIEPHVIFVDAAHNLDDASLCRLENLVLHSPATSPLLVVATLEFSTRPAVVTLRRAMESSGAPTLILRPLEPAQSLQLATASLGRPPTEDELVLIEHARGVPRRIVQIAASLGASKPRRSPGVAAIPITPLIGRQDEISELLSTLPNERLITITGPGGCGKTRLAYETLAQMSDASTLDVVWVELARRTDGPGVLNALCVALGLVELEQGDLANHIVVSLQNRGDTLIVLDNAEHLLSAASDIVQRILVEAPSISVLCTSREPLDVPGEIVWRVPPLTSPTPGDLSDVESLQRFESVQLFLERAARVRRGFVLTAANATHVATICGRLDGLPLAIELAAARVRSMPPDRIAAQLSDQLQGVPTRAQNIGDRHETLRSCIAWSEGLLEGAERVVFRRMGVFVGGFTMEAAHAIAEAFSDVEPYDVNEAIRRLVDKSLLVLEDERDRFVMLETIRSFAIERLEELGEATAARDAHANWFAQWLGRFDEVSQTNDAQQFIDRTPGWLRTLDSEIGNCSAAFNWVETGGATSLRLTAGLGYYWLIRGQYQEVVRYGLAAIEKADRTSVEFAEAAVWIIGPIYNASLELGEAFGESVTEADATNAEPYRTRIDGNMTHTKLGDLGPTTKLLERYQLLRSKSAQHHDWLSFTNCTYIPASVCAEFGMVRTAEAMLGTFTNHRTLLVQANCALWRGELDLARRLAAEAAAIVDADLDNPLAEVAEVGYIQAQIALAGCLEKPADAPVWQQLRTTSAGAFTDTVHFFEAVTVLNNNDAALALPRLTAVLQSSAPIYRSYARTWLARIHLALGDQAAAREHASMLLSDWSHLRAPGFEAIGHLVMAECTMSSDTHSALDHAHQSLASATEFELWTAAVDALEAIGPLLIQNQRLLDGARLLGAAHAARDRTGYRHRFAHRNTYVATAHLAAKSTVGWAEGLTLSLSAAVELAQRMRGDRGRAAFGWESLTPTEIQVVELVTTGLTNPQIAERLFISRATVKTHLVHVYEKLGISNRSELAAQSAARGA